MGLLKGTFTFTRYRIIGNVPPNFSEFVNRQIRKFAFQELSSVAEESSMGWAAIEDVTDTRFEFANYALSEYLIFSLRVDRKHVPPSLLRIKIHETEKQLLSEKKQERLFKGQRKEIAEAVRLNLLAKALPVPSSYDVCWCVSKKWLVFGSHTEKVSDDFVKLFERTFEMKLQPYTPWDEQ